VKFKKVMHEGRMVENKEFGRLKWELEKQDLKDGFRRLREWCWKHNTIPLKDLPGIHLASCDGGWINNLELWDEIREIFGREMCG